MVTRKVAPALAAGCTVVLKPAPETPLSALALAVLAQDAGLPDGVLNVVTCSETATPDIGRLLATSPDVAKLTFTGSTQVGRTLMALASPTLKRLSLELGGHAPVLVFPSARDTDEHVERAVDMVMTAKFRNAGQTCVAPNRIYVHRSIHDTFLAILTRRVSALRVGNGQTPGIQIGPLISNAALEKVDAHVQDALAKGARLHTGGNRLPALGRRFYAPTVLSECTHTMILSRQETFGPVCPVFCFDTEEEAIQKANDSEFGLAAYAYSTDVAQSYRVSQQLQYGMVGMNEGLMSYEVAPFGGVKQSGFGREGSLVGMDEYLQLKYICQQNAHK
jgi:succinate-semialdehyde dehydrogenase/glutarate-semialdehyde dehydrogenase